MSENTNGSYNKSDVLASKRVRGGVGPLKQVIHKPAVPNIKFPNFKYNGGLLINFPQVYTSFWGPSVTDATHIARASRLNQFVQDMLRSRYIGILGQYGTLPGTFVSSNSDTISTGHTPIQMGKSDIERTIQILIDAGEIPEPPESDNNIVLLVYLDEHIEVNQPQRMCESTSDTAFGYHDYFKTKNGHFLFYAIIPSLDDNCIRNSCPGGDLGCSLKLTQTQEQRLTQVTSHEYAEMCTDPIFTEGWYQNVNSSEEVGDICNSDSTTISVGNNQWTVQLLYSNIDDRVSNGSVTCVSEPPVFSDPAIAGVDDKVYFFAKTVDGRIFYKAPGIGQIGWAWIEVDGNGRIGSAPSAGGVKGHLFVAAKGLDQNIISNQADLGQPFNNFWNNMRDFSTDVAPAVIGVGDAVYFFAKHLDGRIFINWAPPGQGGVGWREVEGNGLTDTAPVAGSLGSQLFVAVKGLDGHIYVNQADVSQNPEPRFNNFWNSTKDFITDVSPAVTGVGNKLYFFAKRLDGRVFYNNGLGWREVEGNGHISSAPASGAVGNHVFIAANGLDGRVYLNQADLDQPFGAWFLML